MKPLFLLFLNFLAYVNAGLVSTDVVPGSIAAIRAIQGVSYSSPVAYPQAYTYSQQVAYPQPLSYAQPLIYAQPALAYSSPVYRQPLTHPVYYSSPLLSANHHPHATVSIVTPPQATIPNFPQLPTVPQQPDVPQFPQAPQFPQQPDQPQIPQLPQGGFLPVEPANDSTGPQFPQVQQPTSPPSSEGTPSDDDSVSVEAAIR